MKKKKQKNKSMVCLSTITKILHNTAKQNNNL